MRRLGLRFRVQRIMVLVAIVGVVLALAKYFFIENRPRDILAATLSALDGEYTVYADGYSEYSFRSIRVGMSIRQVEEIMGPPQKPSGNTGSPLASTSSRSPWTTHTPTSGNKPSTAW